MVFSGTLRYEEAFKRDVKAVATAVEDSPGGEAERLDVFVHPGFYDYFDHPFPVEEDYDAYRERVTASVEASAGTDLVLYPAGWRDETEEYVPEEVKAPEYIRTAERSALLPESSLSTFASELAALQEGGEVHVSGELHGCCYTHIRQLLEEVEEYVSTDFDIIEEEYFPEDEIQTF